MSGKTKLYIDEDWLEPTEKPTPEKAEVGADVAPETSGQAQAVVKSGEAKATPEKQPAAASTSSQELAGGASGEKADKQGGLASVPQQQAAKEPLGAKLKKVPVKTWVLVGVLLLVLVGAVIMVAVMSGGGKSSNHGNKVPDSSVGGSAGEGDKDEGKEPEPEEKPGDETIVLSTGDARVQKLYGYFNRLGWTSELGQLAGFYTDRGAFAGELSEAMMLDLAMANLTTETCVMPPSDENLMKRYEDWQEADGPLPSIEVFQGMYNMGCYSGQAVRDKVKEIFGKDLKLTLEVLAGVQYYGYDAENDEFYNKVGGRGGVFPSFARKLLKAERDGERMYLYENVSVSFPGGPELVSLYDKCLFAQGEAYETNGCGAEDYQWQTGETKFRLVFKRTDAGNYVFEKLERAERE